MKLERLVKNICTHKKKKKMNLEIEQEEEKNTKTIEQAMYTKTNIYCWSKINQCYFQ